MNVLTISGRQIGDGAPCFVVAEAGVNHNGSLDFARQLVDAAAAAGADAVKFQAFRADELASPMSPKASYQREATPESQTHLDMLRALQLSGDDFEALMSHCRGAGILFLASVFDSASVDLLYRLGVAAFKVPSGELTNNVLLEDLAHLKRPVLLSTGMARLGEIDRALSTLAEAGGPPVALLHCTSSYPTPPGDVNLFAFETMRQAFGLPVGYSDHTPGIEVPLAAVALGACIVEKHFTIDRSLPGPDQHASLEPAEFAAMTRGIRIVEQALGDGRKEPRDIETDVAMAARRGLVAARDLQAGEVLTQDCINVMRPGSGLPPSCKPYVIGRRVSKAVSAGEPLRLEVLG